MQHIQNVYNIRTSNEQHEAYRVYIYIAYWFSFPRTSIKIGKKSKVRFIVVDHES